MGCGAAVCYYNSLGTTASLGRRGQRIFPICTAVGKLSGWQAARLFRAWATLLGYFRSLTANLYCYASLSGVSACE